MSMNLRFSILSLISQSGCKSTTFIFNLQNLFEKFFNLFFSEDLLYFFWTFGTAKVRTFILTIQIFFQKNLNFRFEF
jgi:hypothetical protein